MNYKIIHKIITTLLVVFVLALIIRLGKVWEYFGGKTRPNNLITDDTNLQEPDYREIKSYPILLDSLVAMSVEPEGILLAGGNEIMMLGGEGEIVFSKKVPGSISCFATDAGGSMYICVENRIIFLSSQGEVIGSFIIPGEEHLITAIVVSDDSIYLADALNKEVLCMGKNGELYDTIGEPQPERDFNGFIVPSPYFDANLDNFGNLWVSNPGRHELNHFDEEGHPVSSWGKASYALDGFCGCCNPTCFLILPNGSFVTAEKGIPRVKIYHPDGSLDCVVAGPKSFDEGTVGLDLGVTQKGEIVIMDPKRKEIRFFERRADSNE